MNEMVIGRTNKLSCQTAGGIALDMQKLCREQIVSYFSAVPPWEDLPTLGDFLSTFVPGTTVIDINIVQLRGYKNQRTLHKRISATQPVSINDWQEFGTASAVVNDFFQFLMSTPVDSETQALSKLPLKKEEVVLMGVRMNNLESEDSVEHVSIILEDLALLNASISQMYENNIPWTI